MIALALLALLGCTPDPAPAPRIPTVRSLSHPVGWLVEQLAGDDVDHACLQPDGVDARTWRPDAPTIASLQSVDLIVSQGAGFEAWTSTASLPRDRWLDTTAGLDLITRQAKTHSHGQDGEHSHGTTDPHTWSDPAMMRAQAAAIHKALRPLVAEEDLNKRLDVLNTALNRIDMQLGSALAPFASTPMAANHPAFGYLARRYSLTIRDYDLDPDKAIDADLSPWLAEGGSVLLWETTPSDAAQNSQPNVRHTYIDPLEHPDGGSYDYLKQATANISRWNALNNATGTPEP